MQRENIQSWNYRIKRSEGERGAGVLHLQMGPDLTVEVHKLEEREKEVTVMVDVGSPAGAWTQQRGRSRSESSAVF